ncbi:MAG: hypothetical protein ABFR90_02585 [Planctomycetota bacterium]
MKKIQCAVLVKTILLGVLYFVSLTVGVTPQNIQPTHKATHLTSVFNDAIVADGAHTEEIRKISLNTLKKNWYCASVTQKSGMFNPVFLPFEFVCKAGKTDPKQSLTFPCLLSFKFDFVPDNFSARHPAFIYRKKPIWNAKPGETKKIAHYIEYWEATHAFGGTVVQHENGYSGQMIVYNMNGQEVLKKKYETPVPYFSLMGQMVKSWMDFRKQPISDGLYNELIRPMTNDMECVHLYGQSFYKPWRTQEEWDIYEQILQRDPNFGEVRFWYANQKSWATGSHANLQVEKGRALQDHLVMPALYEFHYSACREKEIVLNYHKSLSYAQSICTENAMIAYLTLNSKRKRLPLNDLDSFLPIAEKNPCYYPLLRILAREYRKRGISEKSIPLYLSAVFSGYMPGTGSFEWEWFALAEDFYNLGYYNESILCGLIAIRDGDEGMDYSVYRCLGKAYRELFDFETAVEMFDKMTGSKGGELDAWLCPYQHGNLQLLENLRKTKLPPLNSPFYNSRQLLSEGKYSEALTRLSPKTTFNTNGTNSLESQLIATDICLLSGDLENARKYAVRAWYIAPRSRQVNFLLSRAFEGDERVLGRYAAVESFVFENSAWRESIIATMEQPLHFDPDELLLKLNEVKSHYIDIDQQSHFDFWQQFTPFEIEYLCLGLLKTGNLKVIDDTLALYKAYGHSMKRISEKQKMHCRTFFIQLLNLLPEEKKQQWISDMQL